VKTDMVYLTKGGFWLTVSQVLVSFSSFILAIAFAHFVSKEAYGQYKYVLSIAGILGTFTLTGLGAAVLRSVSRGYEGSLQYAFWINIRWSILFFLSSLVLSIYYFFNHNFLLGAAMLVMGSFSPFLSSSNLYSSFLNAKKDFRRHALYFTVLGNLVPYSALFATMLVTTNPIWLVIVYFISNTLIGIVLYRRVVKLYSPAENLDPGMVGYSKHLSVMGILNGIANNIDQVLVFHYLGAAELAIYNFAIALPNQSKGPLKGLSTLMFPKFVEHTEKNLQTKMNHKFMWFFVSSLIMAIVYILLAPKIFLIFFPKYISSVFFSQIFALSLVAITFNPADVYLSAKKKIKEQYIGNISSSIIQIGLTFTGIIWGGLLGLVVARVATRIINSMVSGILYAYSIHYSNPERES